MSQEEGSGYGFMRTLRAQPILRVIAILHSSPQSTACSLALQFSENNESPQHAQPEHSICHCKAVYPEAELWGEVRYSNHNNHLDKTYLGQKKWDSGSCKQTSGQKYLMLHFIIIAWKDQKCCNPQGKTLRNTLKRQDSEIWAWRSRHQAFNKSLMHLAPAWGDPKEGWNWCEGVQKESNFFPTPWHHTSASKVLFRGVQSQEVWCN